MANLATPISRTDPSVADGPSGPTAPIGQLGKQEFLKLLIAQIRNQDPMNPMEDREFVTQLAQFSSLEALDSISKQLDGLARAQTVVQAAALVGKRVEARLADGTTVSGTVTEVRLVQGSAHVVVDNQVIELGRVQVIFS